MGTYAKGMAKANKILMGKAQKNPRIKDDFYLIVQRRTPNKKGIHILVELEKLDEGFWSKVYMHDSENIVVIPNNKYDRHLYWQSQDASKMLLAQFLRERKYNLKHLPNMHFFGEIVSGTELLNLVKSSEITYEDIDIQCALYSPMYYANLSLSKSITDKFSPNAKANYKIQKKIGEIISDWSDEMHNVLKIFTIRRMLVEQCFDLLDKNIDKAKLTKKQKQVAMNIRDELKDFVIFINNKGLGDYFNIDLMAPQNFAYHPKTGDLILLDPLYPLSERGMYASDKLGDTKKIFDKNFGAMVKERNKRLLEFKDQHI